MFFKENDSIMLQGIRKNLAHVVQLVLQYIPEQTTDKLP